MVHELPAPAANALLGERALDGERDRPQPLAVAGLHGLAGKLGQEEPIAAVGEVPDDAPDARHVDREVAGAAVRGNVLDGDHAVHAELRTNRARGRVEPHRARPDAPEVLERAHDADRAVAAHPERSHVVEEDDTGDGAARDRRREQRPDERVVAARLEDCAAPEWAESPVELLAAGLHGRGLKLGPPADHDARRLALGVRIDDLDRLGKVARRHSASRVKPPSTRRQTPRGLRSASSSGIADCGKSW